ncbi:sulfate adenylyltransferase subunit 1 [Leptospira borgpetersenii]|uniref:sulfate adenylyltransferase n=1 Tax=Leptospira borgpetersenii serovar Javanica str. UI 09931 TaxID=1049767 RepID=A0AAV3JCN1_LEPBO|nr:GTP-binding protein [Leptospira borgpetersenii]AXX16889.1 sulfate adenylyltransferase [Leptospira borgpetersenii serovar Ceylonica]EKQ93847.1 sulfate adenylyltransferase, large subunit [Leptospira borgpetersenii str. UI 09149]EMN57248.1 sulfate adenylyltransferase, large subunit [Leptospira borgpetersenii serovar Javanica str. MK146]EPG57399.1 sulfate adenylyltransferase, large subunit [Leptospira borgpetersenii serovar Javanica str. UI 09931]MDQ7243281.1 GTP-binding protein [Leptospira bor
MDLLRFITAGSVDDGKSTLIGRLLYDSKSIFEDQLEAIEKTARGNNGQINLALLTDGLKAEREQGITIDVAYKYFSTPKRKFIIADAPGHVQYTRNMVTGASNSNLAIILIDARKGVIEQTYRHSYIASMLRIPHLVVCVNKMDLVEFSQARYEEIKAEYLNFASRLDIKDIEFIPISALNGDNVVDKSENLSWYEGRTLLSHLEEVYIESDENIEDARFPVQYVIRPLSDEHHDYRGYAGQVRSGIFRKGDSITVLPSGFTSTIEAIDTYNLEVEEAFPPMSVTIRLKDEIDISRGDMIVQSANLPVVSQDLEANICWMDSKVLLSGNKYLLRQTTNAVKAIVKEIEFKIAPDTHEKQDASKGLTLNEIGKIKIRTAKPVSFDEYRTNRSTGSFILVDEGTNSTVGAGMITGVGA